MPAASRRPGEIVVDETIASTLEALEVAENYKRWIYGLAHPHLDGPTLEIGAGHGTFTGLLAERGVHAVEPSQVLAERLAEAHRGDSRVEITVGTVDDVPAGARFGSAVAFNVLEHIEDDAGALRSIHDRLQPGGSLVLWVPAFELLYGNFDLALGHHRRYRLRQLTELVESCDYRIVDARYVNSAGWFSWLVGARLLGKAPTSRAVIAVFDRVVVPVVRGLERVVRPPLGQSVFLAARKPLVG